MCDSRAPGGARHAQCGDPAINGRSTAQRVSNESRQCFRSFRSPRQEQARRLALEESRSSSRVGSLSAAGTTWSVVWSSLNSGDCEAVERYVV